MRDSAFLARGVDRYGHFDLESLPEKFDSPEALAAHEQFRTRRKALQSSL